VSLTRHYFPREKRIHAAFGRFVLWVNFVQLRDALDVRLVSKVQFVGAVTAR
jgi:hypothetical protein